ncbi:DUF2294 domain-containing protein [Salinibacillus xinjiangensis]|uniref:DUF2294 family protein n=1 Tax=Salinibacillus xinjiangensis TaxID=1229268 RepID=A0A6G1X799_9BACI|nr:DUF2294 domain-containing protein [Salinibacillus xinjiangensis]MRG86844.1 DUF2294 family protein [Salinibacillus xinjiangensis]
MDFSKKTKGALEAEISQKLTQWEKDFLGRGSVSVKTDILRDMIIVTLQGILTPAEYRVCKTSDGAISIKNTRSNLVESGRTDLGQLIRELTGEEVITFHTDISTKTGERLMVFKLSSNLQKKMK